MKLTKIFLAIVAFCTLSCGEVVGPQPPTTPGNGSFVDDSGIVWEGNGVIVGQWSLTSYGYPVQPQIYVEFCEDGTFNLYQRFTDIAWVSYKGSYSLSGNILTGKYSDGTPLTGYKVSYGKKDNLRHILLASQENEAYMQIYEECEIPTYIIEEAKSGTKAVRSAEFVPVL